MQEARQELMFINGKEVESRSGKWVEVENPSRKQTLAGRVPRANEEDVDAAVKAAHQAFDGWRMVPSRQRGEMLMKIVAETEKTKDEIAYTLSSENGNALRTQSKPEVNIGIDALRYFAGLGGEMKGTTYPSPNNNMFIYTRREPVGVSAAIVPWNAPVLLTALKIGPALVTGNTMVLKVASDAPMAAMRFAKIAAKMLPPGVLNVISGPGVECGDSLLRHPLIDKISLTGSTEVGKHVLHRAADRILNSTMELGGKNPQIVFPDCAMEETVKGMIPAVRMTRQGQSCTSGSRVYVHKSIFDDFVDKLSQEVSKMKVGDACDEESDMGAVTSKVQYDKIIATIREAMEEEKTRLVCGGLPPEDGPLSAGYHLIPTVFTAESNDTILAKIEIFGPVVVCIPWEDEKEVVRLANDTEYGLAAFVWSGNAAKAMKMAHEIRAGFVLVNNGGGQIMGNPYGGMKVSGLGREFSLEGMLDSYTELKSVLVDMEYGLR